MKKMIISLMLLFLLVGCSNKKQKLYLLNFGDYISPDVVKKFEKEFDCEVVQDLFEANEEAEVTLANGSTYDLVCLSNYMIEQIVKNEKYQESNFSGTDAEPIITNSILKDIDVTKITNEAFIDLEDKKLVKECYMNISANYSPEFYNYLDKTYALPYFKGSQGICYNKTQMLKRDYPIPKKWQDLSNPAYVDQICMPMSVRDLFTIPEYALGYSSNETDFQRIQECTEWLLDQKPLVQAYCTDQLKEKLIGRECLLAPLFSGDMQYVVENNKNDEYVYLIPEGKKSIFIDCWCLCRKVKNEELAYKFLNFIYEPDIYKENAEYVGYESCLVDVNNDEYLTWTNNTIDNSSSVELERSVFEAINFYSEGLNVLQSN